MKILMSKPIVSFLRTLGAGMLTVLPIVLTVVIIVWSAGMLETFLGPNSPIGQVISSIGLVIVPDRFVAYLLGTIAVFFGLYALGLFVQSRFQGQLNALMDRTIGRIPLMGSIYRMTNRFVGLFDQQEDMDISSMSPVWCLLGGDGATAVLALMSTAEPIELGGRSYCVVLIPTAPIPFGGGLIFVPSEWVRPADFGVEALTSIYLSMGVTTPQFAGGPEGQNSLASK